MMMMPLGGIHGGAIVDAGAGLFFMLWSIRGGRVITTGCGLLLVWWAISGSRPTSKLFDKSAECSKTIGVAERIAWAILGAGLSAVGLLRFRDIVLPIAAWRPKALGLIILGIIVVLKLSPEQKRRSAEDRDESLPLP